MSLRAGTGNRRSVPTDRYNACTPLQAQEPFISRAPVSTRARSPHGWNSRSRRRSASTAGLRYRGLAAVTLLRLANSLCNLGKQAASAMKWTDGTESKRATLEASRHLYGRMVGVRLRRCRGLLAIGGEGVRSRRYLSPAKSLSHSAYAHTYRESRRDASYGRRNGGVRRSAVCTTAGHVSRTLRTDRNESSDRCVRADLSGAS